MQKVYVYQEFTTVQGLSVFSVLVSIVVYCEVITVRVDIRSVHWLTAFLDESKLIIQPFSRVIQLSSRVFLIEWSHSEQTLQAAQELKPQRKKSLRSTIVNFI